MNSGSIVIVIIAIVVSIVLYLNSISKDYRDSDGNISSNIFSKQCVSSCKPISYKLALHYWKGAKVNPSIHGLWANPSEYCTSTQRPAQCCGEPFNYYKLSSSTVSALNAYWTGGMNTCGGKVPYSKEGFWCHEWETHGVCTGMTQEAYFMKTIELYKRYNSLTKCSFGKNCYICFDGKLENGRKC